MATRMLPLDTKTLLDARNKGEHFFLCERNFTNLCRMTTAQFYGFTVLDVLGELILRFYSKLDQLFFHSWSGSWLAYVSCEAFAAKLATTFYYFYYCGRSKFS